MFAVVKMPPIASPLLLRIDVFGVNVTVLVATVAGEPLDADRE